MRHAEVRRGRWGRIGGAARSLGRQAADAAKAFSQARIADFRKTSIRARLALLVAALALPLNGLVVAVIVSLANASAEAQRAGLVYAARSTAAGLDAQLGKYIAVAEDLIRSPALLSNHLDQFEAEARQSLAGIPESWVLVADPEGNQLLNTSPRAHAPLPRRNALAVAGQHQAFERASILIGNLRPSTITGEWIATIEAPVLEDGKPFRILAIAIGLRGFRDLLAARSMPPGWLAGIIDENGRFVAHVPDEQRVGQLASEGWRHVKDREGVFELASVEGDAIVQANASSAQSGWRVGIAVKRTELTAATRRTVHWAVLLGGALSIVSLLCAAVMARTISEPLGQLRRNASAAIRGKALAFSPGTPEIEEVWTSLQRAVAERRRLDEHLAAIVGSSNDAIVTKTTSGIVTNWNAGAERVFGYTADEMIGQSIRRLIPADRMQEEDDILARIRRGERIDHYETVRVCKGGRLIDVSVSISPLRDGWGRIVGASKIARDVTEQKAHTQRIAESERRLGQILNTLNAYVGLLDAEGRLVEVNTRVQEVAGAPREALVGRRMQEAPWWPSSPASAARIGRMIEHALAGESVRCDLEYTDVHGSTRWVDFQAAPVVDAAGRVSAVVPSGVDITERKLADERVRALMFELNHRAKNLLGLVLAIARQTAAASPEEFLARFSHRIQGLAANQSLLVRNDWRGVELSELVRSQLMPFEDLVGSRVGIVGPKLIVAPKAAQGIGMALYELATNASKYGALSNDEGRIDVAWTLEGGEFRLSWRESGGPPVQAPSRSGFGRKVLTTLTQASLDGRVVLEHADEGILWSLSCPSESISGPPPPMQASA